MPAAVAGFSDSFMTVMIPSDGLWVGGYLMVVMFAGCLCEGAEEDERPASYALTHLFWPVLELFVTLISVHACAGT